MDMKLFTVLAVLIGGGSLLGGHPDLLASAAGSRGREVVIETKDLVARFSRAGSRSDAFMLFGWQNWQDENMLAEVTLSGISIRHAKAIKRRYPDWRKCKSPGKHQARKHEEDLDFVKVSRGMRRALDNVTAHLVKRQKGGGDVCVKFTADRLKLKSVRDKKKGAEVARQYAGVHRQGDYYLARTVRRVDCRPLLR
jgi:hypothetical protein